MAAANERPGGAHGPAEEEIHFPGPSIWPLVCGAGIGLLAFGILTSPAFSVAGVLLMVRAIAGWIGELRHG